MNQHLSFPLGNSVNSYFDPELATVQYTSFDKVLSTISEIGRGAELARMDILSAFRLLILHPDEFELFGFHIKNQFYFDKCLPMGCSASCALLKFFSTFLEWAIKFKSGKISVEHYLDDFLLAGNAGTGDCLQLMDRLRIICEDWGVPLAEDKTIGRSFFFDISGIGNGNSNTTMQIVGDKRKIGICTWQNKNNSLGFTISSRLSKFLLQSHPISKGV
jgi:hypothetical protein